MSSNVLNLRPRPPRPHDRERDEVYTGAMADYPVSASLTIGVWGRVIAALEQSPSPEDHAAAKTVRSALSRGVHPSFQPKDGAS